MPVYYTVNKNVPLCFFFVAKGMCCSVSHLRLKATKLKKGSQLGKACGNLTNSISTSKNKMNCELMLTYDTPTLGQTGSRNLMGPKTIWSTYIKLVTKYQICVINSCWEKCDVKCAYMFNVYRNQLSRQTGSRNLTGPKTLPTIWHTYMKLVTKYQIPVINSCWEKCDEKCAYTNVC